MTGCTGPGQGTGDRGEEGVPVVFQVPQVVLHQVQRLEIPCAMRPRREQVWNSPHVPGSGETATEPI